MMRAAWAVFVLLATVGASPPRRAAGAADPAGPSADGSVRADAGSRCAGAS